jgi:hypothetical protein
LTVRDRSAREKPVKTHNGGKRVRRLVQSSPPGAERHRGIELRAGTIVDVPGVRHALLVIACWGKC